MWYILYGTPSIRSSPGLCSSRSTSAATRWTSEVDEDLSFCTSIQLDCHLSPCIDRREFRRLANDLWLVLFEAKCACIRRCEEVQQSTDELWTVRVVGTNRPSRNISVVPFLQDGMEPRSLRYCAKTKLSHFHCSSVSMYASPVSTTCSLGDAAQNARSMGFTDAILGEVPDGPCRASCWKRLVAGTIKRAS